jgi:two-component system phosphate regulon sensor histidine kinase PhoR
LRAGRPRDLAARTEYLDTIVAESERLSRLLDNVLDFARIERGTKNYAMRLRHVGEIVEDARRILAHTLAQRGFTLDVVVDADLPPVFIDADATEQAVLNLIVNAMKYSGDARRISVRLAQEGSWVVIRVVDSGIGIEAAEQEQIFTQFYRGSGPQNATIPGAGLGLTIVRHIAAAHHGRVVVDSAIGQGSTFSLYLPITAGLPAPLAVLPSAPATTALAP